MPKKKKVESFDALSIERWRAFGWNDPFWEVCRFYRSLRSAEKKKFIEKLSGGDSENIEIWNRLGSTEKLAGDLISYCRERDSLLEGALNLLRTEDQAKEFCEELQITWKTTKTKNQDHHQSSKTLIATVSKIAEIVCTNLTETLDPNPQKRCIWYVANHLHVTARNLDGAIPSLKDPYIVWEIKEYWGKSKGGSKMSDAVYECHLVGREIREYEERSKHKISHIVFLDGKEQWNHRKSDLARFIDLHNQGLIDYLFIGKSIETEWETTLTRLIRSRKDN